LPTRAGLCLWIGAHSITLNASAGRSRAKGTRDKYDKPADNTRSKHYSFFPFFPPSPHLYGFAPLHILRSFCALVPRDDRCSLAPSVSTRNRCFENKQIAEAKVRSLLARRAPSTIAPETTIVPSYIGRGGSAAGTRRMLCGERATVELILPRDSRITVSRRDADGCGRGRRTGEGEGRIVRL